ncbi:MAG: DUF1684 domain-containing protein [Candidatus Acidiferrales bacterium]
MKFGGVARMPGKFRRCISILFLCICAASSAVTAQEDAYRAGVEKWRQNYEASLKADNGWLTVSGLFWLHEGENHFGSDPLNDIVLTEGSLPPDAGYFDFHHGKTIVHVNPGVAITMNGRPVQEAEIRPDSPDQILFGDIALLVHQSGERYSIRLKDKNSNVRKNFAGLHWFPVDASYRVTAKFVPYDQPKQVEIQNIIGDTIKTWTPGYVEFTLKGQTFRLEPETSDAQGMSFVFRDLTSGKETYPAARFLDTAAAKDGEVTLDFNEAYNPPCAYNPYTTCPLPLPGNRLRVRIEAGELAYMHDRGN